MPFELHVALRYLLAKRKQAFISVISLISTLGLSVGVTAVVIALALMTGLQGELRDRILGSNPHVFAWKRSARTDYIRDTERLRSQPHVTGAAPAVLGKALVTAAGEQAFISLKGIDPALEPSVTDIGGAMRSGSLAALRVTDPEATDAVLLGSDLAQQLAVQVGDTISVLTGQGTLTPMGLMPRQRRLRVAGIFNLGLYEIDSQYGFVSIDVAKKLLDKDDVDAIQVRLDDLFVAREVSTSFATLLGDDYSVQDWTEMNRSLFSALTLEKMAISLTIGLIVMVAALNIIASLILLVMEKHRDIAILKTMGASAGSVTLIFMLQGIIIGLVGTTIGGAGGYALARLADRYQLVKIPVDVYQISHVPFRVEPLDFAMVIVAALVICFLATIYPSRQAARLDPSQALRYE